MNTIITIITILTMLTTSINNVDINNIRTIKATEIERTNTFVLYEDTDGELWYAENDLDKIAVILVFNTCGNNNPYDDEIIFVY